MSLAPARPPREHLMDTTEPAALTRGATDTREQQMPSTVPPRGRGRAYVVGGFVAAVVAAVVGVVLLTGGGDDQPDAAVTTAPAPVTISPTPSPTVSAPPKPEDVAAAQAQARYRDYLRVTREVAKAGYTDLAPFGTVAVDPETGVLFLTAERLAGITTTGDTEVVSLTVQSVELDPAEEYPSVRLLACLDVSQVTAVKASTGESVVSPDRLDRLRSEVVVRDIPPGAFTDGRKPGWYVAEVVQRGEPC